MPAHITSDQVWQVLEKELFAVLAQFTSLRLSLILS